MAAAGGNDRDRPTGGPCFFSPGTRLHPALFAEYTGFGT